MGKKILTMILAFATLFMMTVLNVSAASTEPTITLESVQAESGQDVKVNVLIENNPGIWGIDLRISYDKSALTLISVENGNFYQELEWTQGNLNSDTYILSYEASGFDNVTKESGILAVLNFKVSDTASVGDYTVRASYNVGDIINVNFDDINFRIVDGKVSVKEEQIEITKPVTEVFVDVFENDWFADSIQFVYDNGMMSGSNGSFKPNDNMTRAMMVTTLYRLSGSPEVNDYTATSLFSDVEAGSWYEDAVNWAYNTKVTTGYTDSNGNPTHFGSNDNVTREQLAVFLYRYSETQGYDVTVRADISDYVGYSEISDYAKEAMQWAVGVGLISGMESVQNGVTIYDLAPKGSATRAQLATILMRFCGYYEI